MSKLVIKDLHVSVEKKEILKGINITINSGDKIALLGSNGQGKTTLFFSIMGHPKYIITKGSIFFDDIDILKLPTDERSKLGIFFGFQNPCEIPGVVNSDFLKNILDVRSKKTMKLFDFYKKLDDVCNEVKVPFEIVHRNLNENFSGGEKKKNEILQMILVNPKISLLDEIDSGLDVDSIKNIAKLINKQQKKGTGFIIISHRHEIFDIIKPNKVIVMFDGKIVASGNEKIIEKINKNGFDFINSLNIKNNKTNIDKNKKNG